MKRTWISSFVTVHCQERAKVNCNAATPSKLRHKSDVFRSGGLLLMILLIGSIAYGQTLQFKEVWPMQEARGINDSGSIVGWGILFGKFRSWVATKEQWGQAGEVVEPFTDLPKYQGTTVVPYGISSDGTIVGRYLGEDKKVHGFWVPWESQGGKPKFGDYTAIDIPEADGTEALGIVGSKDSWTIVGSYLKGDKWHGFVQRKDKQPELVDYPGSTSTKVWGVNKAGWIVGEYIDGAATHGFSRDAAKKVWSSIDLATGKGSWTVAYGINDSSPLFPLIAGTYSDGQNKHGFVATHKIDNGKRKNTSLFGINNGNFVTGDSPDPDKLPSGIVGIPQKPPSCPDDGGSCPGDEDELPNDSPE